MAPAVALLIHGALAMGTRHRSLTETESQAERQAQKAQNQAQKARESEERVRTLAPAAALLIHGVLAMGTRRHSLTEAEN